MFQGVWRGHQVSALFQGLFRHVSRTLCIPTWNDRHIVFPTLLLQTAGECVQITPFIRIRMSTLPTCEPTQALAQHRINVKSSILSEARVEVADMIGIASTSIGVQYTHHLLVELHLAPYLSTDAAESTARSHVGGSECGRVSLSGELINHREGLNVSDIFMSSTVRRHQ